MDQEVAGQQPGSAERLFETALGLVAPWRVVAVRFEGTPPELCIDVGFTPGAHFPCPQCGEGALGVYDTQSRRWRHMNFFQYRCYLQARVPRVRCPRCGVHQVPVPWARSGSGFSLLWEAEAMDLTRQMPVRPAAEVLGEHDTRVLRLVRHHVLEARARADYSQVRRVGVDELASRRGQNYVTNFVDLDTGRVLFSTPGRDHTTLERFAEDLRAHGGDPAQIREFTLDLSAPYAKGIALHFPQAEITYDKFHVLKLMTDALDEVRRQERRHRPELKGTRYLWLKNETELTAAQEEQLARLRRAHLKTGRAYALRQFLGDLWRVSPAEAEEHLRAWYNWAIRSRLEPVKRVARTIKQHWHGVLNSVRNGLTNAMLEGLHSLVQAAKARARGYRSVGTLITVIYHLGAQLDYRLPSWLPEP